MHNALEALLVVTEIRRLFSGHFDCRESVSGLAKVHKPAIRTRNGIGTSLLCTSRPA